MGTIWETFIFAEFRKAATAHGQPGSLWFYRDDQGREVDFVKQHHGQLDLFEVKWTENPDQKWFDRINEVAAILQRSRSQNPGESRLLCRTRHAFRRDNVYCEHAADFFNRQA